LIRSFERLMRGFVSSPEERLSALPRISAAETHQLTVEWSDTELPAAEGDASTLIGLVLAQMARTPDAEALVHRGGIWTYSDLARRVDRLACRLRALGVGW
jgi:non-ribosomal peptide synthetase component F